MAINHSLETDEGTIPAALRQFIRKRTYELGGLAIFSLIIVLSLALASWSISDPSFNHANGL